MELLHIAHVIGSTAKCCQNWFPIMTLTGSVVFKIMDHATQIELYNEENII